METNMFWDYFKIGWEHIINRTAWDHLLFIMALSALYLFRDWKQVLVLVTAFTIGHSATLVLATFNLVRFSSAWIEFLIPVTIMITALYNIFKKKAAKGTMTLNYLMALVFGLVHGMGFANGLRSLLGKESEILVPLLGFNLGLEAGQVVVVLGVLIIAAILQGGMRVNRKDWILFISGGAFFAALVMAMERIPFNL
jgi:hypothetical protein